MSTTYLATADLRELFAEEIEARSGQVADTFDDGSRIIMRSLLPQSDEVQPKDRVDGGVALRATPEETCVIPYVFRQVCKNGAIMARSLQAHRLVFKDDETPGEVDLAIRAAVRDCCAPEVFENSVQVIRSSVHAEFDGMLTMMPLLETILQSGLPRRFVKEILNRFLGDGSRGRFGLMNAVTSVARDTTDPEDRWRLEELGGGIAAGLLPQSPSDASGAELEPSEQMSQDKAEALTF